MIPADPIEQAAQAGKALEAMLRTEKLLRAEIERLTTKLEALQLSTNHERQTRKAAEARVERLEAELRWISTGGDLWSRQVALAALAGKSRRVDET